MKAKELKNRESIPKSIMMFTSVLLVMLTLALVGCNNKDDETVSYTVMFDADGGTPVPTYQHVEAGNTATAPTANPTKTGNVFLFWHLEGIGTAYNFLTPVNSNITLYAKWQKEATAEYWQVAWELNEGAWSSGDNHATQVVKGGTLAEPTVPTKTGKTFDGWYKEAALTNKINFPYDVSAVTANFTFYAKWADPSAEYWQITWELNDGAWPATDDNHVVKVEKGSTLAEPAAPTKAESTFDGWYKEIALTNKITFPHDITDDTKLYAKWVIDRGEDPSGYKMFTSISALKSWLVSKPANTAETPYKVGLKGINLDTGSNWSDLGVAIKGSSFVDLDLQSCTTTSIPNGRTESKWEGNTLVITHYGVFVGCNNLIAITLPEGVKSVGSNAFYACNNLAAITLPRGVKTIGKYAFEECSNLGSLTLSDGLTEIHACAFKSCSALNSVSLPEGLKIIDAYAFEGSGLTSIIVPSSVRDLKTKTFTSCQKLKTVVLKEGVESIGEMVFSSCTRLESVTLPSSLKTIGTYAFNNCYLLKTIVLPQAVTTIGTSAFQFCESLISIVLPRDLKAIPIDLFSKCKSLKTVTIPALVVNIGSGSFSSCEALTELILLPIIPPVIERSLFFDSPRPSSIKVPPASLNAYKSAAGWSSYASKIVANTN